MMPYNVRMQMSLQTKKTHRETREFGEWVWHSVDLNDFVVCDMLFCTTALYLACSFRKLKPILLRAAVLVIHLD